MMRVFFVAIALIIISAPKSFLNWYNGSIAVFMLSLGIGASEYFYYISKRRTGEAMLTRDGLTLSPLSLYGGLIHTKERTLSKEEVVKVEVGRARDAPPKLLATAPAAGIPTSLVFYLQGDKFLSLYKRTPEEVIAAAEYAQLMWNVAKSDMADKIESKSEEIYTEFVNDHHSSRFRSSFLMLGAAMVAFSIMAAWILLFSTKPSAMVVGLVPIGLVAYMAVMIYLLYQQTYAVKRVKVERNGIELTFKSRTNFIPWYELKGVDIARADSVSKGRDRIACLKTGNRKSYIVKREIGEATQQAYKEANGRDAPTIATANSKPGAVTMSDFNVLKYEAPSLHRKYILVAVALFANGIFLILNFAIRSSFFLLVGILLQIVFMYIGLQTGREIKKFLKMRNDNGRPPIY